MDSVLATHSPVPQNPQKPTLQPDNECAFPEPNATLAVENSICCQISGLARLAKRMSGARAKILEKIPLGLLQLGRITPRQHYHCGVTVISRKACIRLSRGGWRLQCG